MARTYDDAYVRMLIEELFDDITVDEFRDVPDTSGLLARDNTECIEVRLDGERVGAFLFIDGEVHTLLLEPIRGVLAVRAARAAIAWYWEHTDKPCIDSFYFDHRPDVAWFCRVLGFKPMGREDTPYHFNGQPVAKTKVRLVRP